LRPGIRASQAGGRVCSETQVLARGCIRVPPLPSKGLDSCASRRRLSASHGRQDQPRAIKSESFRTAQKRRHQRNLRGDARCVGTPLTRGGASDTPARRAAFGIRRKRAARPSETRVRAACASTRPTPASTQASDVGRSSQARQTNKKRERKKKGPRARGTHRERPALAIPDSLRT